ncbi:nucleotidyltransferase family protein [Skermanella stibiiresistens]|uniref:nucleotidyltransferase family protein n=1 Tax=Skermanella stibiiresistens TaxID=913326 RepID=UPI0004AD00B2|nr:nucleotidyltransferase family protein [Skermanella stibiiresistens]
MLTNRWSALILERASCGLGLADWWLTSGCLAQTVWNRVAGREPDRGILDYDLIYFDPDTSWEAEDEVIRRTADLFSDLPITVQIRNQARVPLWYRAKFGVPYPPVSAASDGIDRFPCRNTAIGIRSDADDHIVHAPFGLDLTFSDTLVPNPELWVPDVYQAKVRRWMTVWPHLTALPWPTRPGIRNSPD